MQWKSVTKYNVIRTYKMSLAIIITFQEFFHVIFIDSSIVFYRKVVPDPSIKVLPTAIGHYPQWEDPSGVVSSYVDFLEIIKQV